MQQEMVPWLLLLGCRTAGVCEVPGLQMMLSGFGMGALGLLCRPFDTVLSALLDLFAAISMCGAVGSTVPGNREQQEVGSSGALHMLQ